MLQRMLIDRMENRILVGVIMFVGIMILVGWVAINENARMSSFERQFEARSIERGAALFASNCATCHGADGRGLPGRAPALNSPLLFGYNYFAGIDAQSEAIRAERQQLQTELDALNEELAAEDTSAEREQEIAERKDEINARLNELDSQLAPLNEQRAELVQQLQPAIDRGYPITVTEEDGTQSYDVVTSRLEQLGWNGTLYDFVFTTLVHGRPTSISYWPDTQMVAWSQSAGGPLRDDQLADLATYILNWDKGDDWTIEDALAVNQYPIEPVPAGAGGAAGEQQPAAGTDVQTILAQIEEEGITGDSATGEAVYNGQQMPTTGGVITPCSSCHVTGAGTIAPALEGTWDRIVNQRLSQSQFEGYTPEQYIVESIVMPSVHVVDGFADAMPATFGNSLSVQDIADLIAFLETTSSE